MNLKPRVYKNPLLTRQPWVVVSFQGNYHFSTWKAAIAFALQPPVTYNTVELQNLCHGMGCRCPECCCGIRPRGYDSRHEENVWRAKHGLEMI